MKVKLFFNLMRKNMKADAYKVYAILSLIFIALEGILALEPFYTYSLPVSLLITLIIDTTISYSFEIQYLKLLDKNQNEKSF